MNRNNWINKGCAGNFNVWHVGKNSYVVTDGRDGPVIGERDQFGLAFTLARRESEYQDYLAEQDDAYEQTVRASYASRGQANLY
jgi:hypothetical protein